MQISSDCDVTFSWVAMRILQGWFTRRAANNVRRDRLSFLEYCSQFFGMLSLFCFKHKLSLIIRSLFTRRTVAEPQNKLDTVRLHSFFVLILSYAYTNSNSNLHCFPLRISKDKYFIRSKIVGRIFRVFVIKNEWEIVQLDTMFCSWTHD